MSRNTKICLQPNTPNSILHFCALSHLLRIVLQLDIPVPGKLNFDEVKFTVILYLKIMPSTGTASSE